MKTARERAEELEKDLNGRKFMGLDTLEDEIREEILEAWTVIFASAMEQAREAAGEALSILTGAYDGYELGGDTWSKTKKLLGRKEGGDEQAR